MRLVLCNRRRSGDPILRDAISTVQGEVTTLEGLGTIEKLHPIQQAFIDEQAVQCGFCLNGVILTANAFLDRNPRGSDAALREALSGVLCRCFVHVRMFRALARYRDQGSGTRELKGSGIRD